MAPLFFNVDVKVVAHHDDASVLEHVKMFDQLV